MSVEVLNERRRQSEFDRGVDRVDVYNELGGVSDFDPTLGSGIPRAEGSLTQESGLESAPPHTNRGGEKNVLEVENSPLLVMGGYDGGIEVGFDGIWEEGKLSEFCLEVSRVCALADDSGNDDSKLFFEYNGIIFLLWRKGTSGRVRYKYILESGGVRYYIHSNPKGDIQPIRIHYDAVSLIGRNFFVLHSEVLKVILSFGFIVTFEKLSRVDMQVMVPYPMSFVQDAFFERRLLSYCGPGNTHFKNLEGEWETFTIGDEIQLCIYNKTAEMRYLMKTNPVKFELMIQECFGSVDNLFNCEFMRVEFRVKREVLKQFEINSVRELFLSENSLSRYFTHKWFRVLREPKKKGHTSEQANADWWDHVQKEFDRWFPGVTGLNTSVFRRTNTDISCDPIHLDKQAIGCLASKAAYISTDEFSPEELYGLIDSTVRKYIDVLFSKYVERFRAKRVRSVLNPELGSDNLSDNSLELSKVYFGRFSETSVSSAVSDILD
jgi:hypothetical protein